MQGKDRADTPAIEVVKLTKYFGDLLAVDHISLVVGKGEAFGFLGPNGAGKTTTVRMLTTLLTPSEGTATIQGRDILKEPYGAREQAGIVPENSNVYVELSAWDNLTFSGELYGVPRRRRDERARDLLQLLGLWDKRRDKASTFSKGMRRRLTIAMALVHKPAVLFLDEPTSGLDVQSNMLIRNLIRTLNREGATVFLTTHQMEEADQMCDRVAIIDHGRIACIDAPEKLRQTIESVQSLVVSFARFSDELAQELVNLEGVLELRKDGDKLRLFTKAPGELIPSIVHLAERHDSSIISLNTVGPSLEDVFLKITGMDVSTGNGGRKGAMA